MSSKVVTLLSCGLLVAACSGAAHHEGYWTSRYIDNVNEDQVFRWGRLACGALKPLPKTSSQETVQGFFKDCSYNQWCDNDPSHIFQDQSVSPEVDYLICGDVEAVDVTLNTQATSFVKTHLVGYRADGALAAADANGPQTQVFNHPEELDPNKLFTSLSGSEQACKIYIDAISKKMQDDVGDAMGFDTQTLLSVASVGSLNCDDKLPSTSPTRVN